MKWDSVDALDTEIDFGTPSFEQNTKSYVVTEAVPKIIFL